MSIERLHLEFNDPEWDSFRNDAPSKAYCRGCNEDFNTLHKFKKIDETLVQLFSHICPRCRTLDNVFGVSSGREQLTVKATDIGEL